MWWSDTPGMETCWSMKPPWRIRSCLPSLGCSLRGTSFLTVPTAVYTKVFARQKTRVILSSQQTRFRQTDCAGKIGGGKSNHAAIALRNATLVFFHYIQRIRGRHLRPKVPTNSAGGHSGDLPRRGTPAGQAARIKPAQTNPYLTYVNSCCNF